jgi:PKD repeat protein
MAALSVGAAFVVSACLDSAQSPPARPDAPKGDGLEGSMLGPVDLVYLCGNKFIVTNSLKSPVHVEYRVVDSDETGSLTLREGPMEDPGYSETELETGARGAVELYQDGQRVARRRNENVACGAPAVSASVAGMSSPTAGSWSAPFPLPIVALHVSLLPTGKVLMWGHLGTPQVWDPANGALTPVPSPAWVFCAGHSFLSDGRLLVSGGHISADHGIPDNTIFTPGTQTWSKSTPMLRGRWYPTNTTMANGDVVIMAGRDENGVEVEEPEVWSAATGAVRVLTTAKRMLPYYPRTFLAPNGKIFYAGEQVTTRYLDPTGTGSWSTVGNHLYSLPRDYGSAVMYDEGKILYVGGGRVTETAETIDLNSAAPAWQWTGSMAFKRRHHVATMLPTGEVLVTAGSFGTAFNDYNAGVHAAEVWNPATGVWTTLASNTITRTYHAASILLPDGRILHSGSGAAASAPNEENAEIFSPPYLFKGARPTIAEAPSTVGYGTTFSVTTPDAADITKMSLIRLGSMTHAFDMNQRFQWLRFTRAGETLTVTAPTSRNITPPGHYMLFILNGAGVPSVAKIVRMGGTGAPPPPPPPTINLTTSGREDATKQYMTLDWTGAVGASIDVFRNGALITTTANDGHYVNSRAFTGTATYVYKVCQAGSTTSCSNESTVQFGGTTNTPPSANFTFSCSGLACNFTDGSQDPGGSVTGWAWDFGDELSSSVQNPSHTYEAAGTYTVTLTATDNGGARGSTSKQVTVTSGGTNAPPTADFTPNCSGLTCNFTDGSTDTDGTVTAWSWTFGDGGTSTSRNPGRTYATGGTYTITLTATDNGGATDQQSKTVTVTGSPSSIQLTVSGREDDTRQYMTLDWTGATGASVDVYRNGALITTTANDGHYVNSRLFTGAASYTYRVCQAGTSVCSNEATVEFGGGAPPGNVAPAAKYGSSCTGLNCKFTDQSTDSDGTITSWSWTFGDGTGSTAPSPEHAYSSAATYTVSLRVTDNDGATGTVSKQITVSGTAPRITLTVTGRSDATKHYMTLDWTGATGASVDVYRNGVRITTTANDGHYTNSRTFTGQATYTYKVCNAGTTTCSNEATVVVR